MNAPRECGAEAFHALSWLRRRAAEFNVDPTHIAVGGASGADHLALVHGLAPDLMRQGLREDRFVPVAEIRRFEHNLQSKVAAPEIQLYPAAQHGVINADRATPEVTVALNQRVVDFLHSHFAEPKRVRSSDRSSKE